MNDTTNHFVQLAAINVNEHVEKKGQLSYLSWVWAIDTLLRHDPAASWEYRWHDGLPFVRIGDTAMVFCTVRAFGVERTMQLPVMDNRNRAIANPDSFSINTAMQRCLVKAIALHGLGLYIYSGEDLPPGQEPERPELSPEVIAALRKAAHIGLDDLRSVFRSLSKEQRKAAMPLIEELKANIDEPA
jgi:hypothetical protein